MDYAPDGPLDGKRILYYSLHRGQAEIDLINTGGSGQSNLTHNLADDQRPYWKP